MLNVLIRKALPHISAILFFILLSLFYFHPQIQGDQLVSTDISSFKAIYQEMAEYAEDTGHHPLWTNSIFSGMPSYQIGIPSKGNVASFFESLTHLFLTRPIGYFVGASICFYILMIVLGANPWLAVIGAVAFSFTTNNIILFEAGHMSKIRTIMQLAPALAGLFLLFRSKYIWGATLYGLGMAMAIYGGHYQMVYYLFLAIGIYLIIELYYALRKKELPAFIKASAFFVLMTLVAVGASTPRLLTTYEYAKDTMRGDPVLEKNEKSSQSSSETDGLAWEYAMRWSNGLKDVMAGIIPRAAGGGSQETAGPNSNTVKNLRQRGIQVPDDVALPLYHGNLPFTSGPAYFGAVLIFLCVLGGFWVRGKLKWWLVISILLTLALSMGSQLSFINRILFDYFPLYNKFRAPSSILTVTALLIPILAVLGLHRFQQGEVKSNSAKKGLYWAGAISLGFCLLMALLGPSLFNFSAPNDSSYVQAGFELDAILADRKMYFRLDALRSAALILAAAAVLWFYLKGSLRLPVAAGILIFLTIVDLWGIDKRYLDAENFIPQQQSENYFQMTDVDRRILEDPDMHYRVHDLSRDPWNDAYRAYWHNLIGGYHAAKLQRYQDMIDYYLGQGNQKVLNMLNAKYFIFEGQNEQLSVQLNDQALGNAWFVENVLWVDTPNEEINAIEGIDPARTAVVHKDFKELFAPPDTTGTGSIGLVSYHPEHLVYESETPAAKLAVFSEVWYGPDKGWKAFIDGEEVEPVRANYILRALPVPAGKHKVEFVFHPTRYYSGVVVAYISSAILLALLLFALYKSYREIDLTGPRKRDKTPERKRDRPGVKSRRKPKRRS